MRLPGASLLLAAMLVVACTAAPGESSPTDPDGTPIPVSPDPEVTFALPTAPDENLPTEAPALTIPPGFAFPVPSPLAEGNADIYAQKALFERTGSLCFTHYDVYEVEGADYEAMATSLDDTEGLLEDGRSYVGPLEDALAALELEPTGIDLADVAYGIGLVTAERALPQLPAGTVWAPRLERFDLADGRTDWTLSGPWIAVVERACGVLPTTPG